MAKWQAWLGGMASALVDPKLPIMFARMLAPDGSASDGGGANMVTGYTIINAANLDAAVAIARQCPLLPTGGSIEVGPTMEMG
jgi:hypothetical protein